MLYLSSEKLQEFQLNMDTNLKDMDLNVPTAMAATLAELREVCIKAIELAQLQVQLEQD